MHGLLYEVVEAVEDDVDVARVRALVEHGVEVDTDVRVSADELPKIELLVPRAHCVPLHEAVGVVALEPGLDQREQQTLREVETVARVEVAPHALGANHQPVDKPREA